MKEKGVAPTRRTVGVLERGLFKGLAWMREEERKGSLAGFRASPAYQKGFALFKSRYRYLFLFFASFPSTSFICLQSAAGIEGRCWASDWAGRRTGMPSWPKPLRRWIPPCCTRTSSPHPTPSNIPEMMGWEADVISHSDSATFVAFAFLCKNSCGACNECGTGMQVQNQEPPDKYGSFSITPVQ